MFACSVGFRLQIQKAFLFIIKWCPGELHVASHPLDQPWFVVILTFSIFHLGIIRKHIHFFQSKIQINTDIFEWLTCSHSRCLGESEVVTRMMFQDFPAAGVSLQSQPRSRPFPLNLHSIVCGQRLRLSQPHVLLFLLILSH